MAQAYVNQKKLDTETKILQANAGQFAKQTMQWLKLVEDFNTALKVRSNWQLKKFFTTYTKALSISFYSHKGTNVIHVSRSV